MRLNRNKLRKMILQELFLLSEPREVSKFNPDDQEFASALKYVAARDYSESGITVDLSEAGATISSGTGAFPTVTLKTSGAEFNSRGGTVFISGPGGLSGSFSDRHFEYGGLDITAFQVAAEEILGRLHGSLIAESAGGLTSVQKLAQGFKIAGEDAAFIRQYFELAVTLGHAEDGTLDTLSLYGGGRIVDFVATPDLAVELNKIMGRIKIGRDPKYRGMYYVAYQV